MKYLPKFRTIDLLVVCDITGQSSTMTGTYAGQFVMEGFLQMHIVSWHRVVITRVIALVPAILVAIATDVNQTASDKLGAWLNVLQSVQLPFALLPLLHFCSDRRIMGEHVISHKMKMAVWTLAVVVMAVNIYLVYHFITDSASPLPHTSWFYMFVCLVGVVYVFFTTSLVSEDLQQFIDSVKGWRNGYRALRNDIPADLPTAEEVGNKQWDEEQELVALTCNGKKANQTTCEGNS